MSLNALAFHAASRTDPYYVPPDPEVTVSVSTRSGNPSMRRGKSKQDWGTPWEFVNALEARFGKLTCDLAATQDNSKAPSYIDEAEDSFTVDWHTLPGVLFLNPPFSAITPWAKKCSEEVLKGAKILLLVPASIGSNWFANYVHKQSLVLGLNGRLQFIGAPDPYPKDLMLCAYGFADEYPGVIGFDVWDWTVPFVPHVVGGAP